MTPAETLSHIAERLSATPPSEVIDELMPDTRLDAIRWARRISHWDEFRGQHTDQTVAVARAISRRAMREVGLTITEDGRVVDRQGERQRETESFQVVIVNQPVEVAYTPHYFPGRDGFAYSGAQNPLSETGFWHAFVPHDAVEALGGPQAFASQYAEARLLGKEREFMEQFEGRSPSESKKKPVVGGHTADFAKERLHQPELF